MRRLIFISYRRQDTETTAKILADRLRRRFGRRRVFFDLSHSLDLGREWSQDIGDALDRAKVTLVVMGPAWLPVLEARLRQPEHPDVVRREVSRALELLERDRHRRVISVRIDGADLPDAARLPTDLRGLVALQGTAVRSTDNPQSIPAQVSDASLEHGEVLDRDIDALAKQLPLWSSRRRQAFVAAIVLPLVLASLALAWPRDTPPKLPLTLAVTATEGAPEGELTELARAVRDEIAQRGASTQIGVLGPAGIARLDGTDPQARARTSASITRPSVQAVIAVVQSTDPLGLPQTGVELFLTSGVSQLAPDMAGLHTLLEPRPGGLDQPGVWRTVEAAVREGGGALVDLLQALASYDVGDLDAAGVSLEHAATGADAQLSALIELFAGTVAVRQADRKDTSRPWLQEARAHYDAALRLRPGYERALLGRAQVRYLNALGEECRTGVNQPELEALLVELAPLRASPREPAADIEYKAALLLGRVRTCLGLAADQGAPREARAEFDHVINAYATNGRPTLRETAQLALLGRGYLYLSFGQTDLAISDLDAAITLTTDRARLCDAYRLKAAALATVPKRADERAQVDDLLSRCPTGSAG